MIMTGASQMGIVGMPPGAIVAMVLFCSATLLGCVAFMIHFWTKLISQQHSISTTPQTTVQSQPSVAKPTVHQLPPRLEPVPSITEQTTRNFNPVFSEGSDRGTKEY